MQSQYLDKRQQLLFILIIVFIVITSFSAGFLLSRYLQILQQHDFEILFESITLLQKHALKPLPEEQQMEYGMIRGLLQVVDDPYTMFVEPAQHELQTNLLEGKFGGIGARFERDQQGYLLLYPFPDSPAARAGITEGDRLLAVDDLQVTPEVSFEIIQAAVRGPVGKKVQLTIGQSPDFTEIILTIKREEFSIPSVTWNLYAENPQVGVIQINVVAATTPEEVKKAVLDLQSRGANYFILDLRNNSGGLLNAGVETASLFLDKRVILQQQYRDKPVEKIESKEKGEFSDLPLVVLVNHASASAAEIIAGALQVNQRSLIIGSNSFGKDSIQLVFDLKDGSSLHITAARWWIPGLNYSISDQGIIPDVRLTEEETQQPIIMDVAADNLLQ